MFKFVPLLCAFLIVVGEVAVANSTSNDFGKYTGELKPLTPEELRTRLEISGDIYVVDATGNKVLFRGPESRQWKFPSAGKVESNWSAQIGDYPAIAIKHVWTVGEDGVLRVKFQQFETMNKVGEDVGGDFRSVKYGKLIKEEERIAKDFSPVIWTAFENEKYRMVVRFIPTLQEVSGTKSIADFPIAGTDVLISDNQGHTWTEPMDSLDDKYIAFVTHRGEIALSYYEFPGAKIIGKAKGNLIEIELEKGLRVRLTSASPFVPGEMTSKVFALYNKDRKSPRVSSTHIIGSSKADNFAEKLRAEARGN
jgi:hypothetical protein